MDNNRGLEAAENNQALEMAQESIARENEISYIVTRADESLKKAGEEALLKADNLDAALEFRSKIEKVNQELGEQLDGATTALNERLAQLKAAPFDLEIRDEEIQAADRVAELSETVAEVSTPPTAQDIAEMRKAEAELASLSAARRSVSPKAELAQLAQEGQSKRKRVIASSRVKGELPKADQDLLAKAFEGKTKTSTEAPKPRKRPTMKLSTVDRPAPPKPQEVKDREESRK